MANTPLEYWEQTETKEKKRNTDHYNLLPLLTSTSAVDEKETSESLACQDCEKRLKVNSCIFLYILKFTNLILFEV